jgi:hypothetical protein
MGIKGTVTDKEREIVFYTQLPDREAFCATHPQAAHHAESVALEMRASANR